MNDDYVLKIEKAIKGDKNALIDIIKLEQNNIYTMLFYLKRNDAELYDIMQNVLIKLTNNIQKLKNPHSFKIWLNQIVVNTYYDYLRKNRKLKQVDNSIIIETPDYLSNPQDRVLYSELDYIIKKTIEKLPMHFKIPITLREIQGLSYDEISNITNTSIGTVKSRIARARNIIKDRVNSYAKE